MGLKNSWMIPVFFWKVNRVKRIARRVARWRQYFDFAFYPRNDNNILINMSTCLRWWPRNQEIFSIIETAVHLHGAGIDQDT